MEVDERKEVTTAKESELIGATKLEDDEEFEEFPIYDKGISEDSREPQTEVNVWEVLCGYFVDNQN